MRELNITRPPGFSHSSHFPFHVLSLKANYVNLYPISAITCETDFITFLML